jgi:LPXTG-motif cell wall-anchored protein
VFGPLPQTATAAPMNLAIGLAAMMLALGLIGLNRLLRRPV